VKGKIGEAEQERFDLYCQALEIYIFGGLFIAEAFTEHEMHWSESREATEIKNHR
jgi:hypothetical protein